MYLGSDTYSFDYKNSSVYKHYLEKLRRQYGNNPYISDADLQEAARQVSMPSDDMYVSRKYSGTGQIEHKGTIGGAGPFGAGRPSYDDKWKWAQQNAPILTQNRNKYNRDKEISGHVRPAIGRYEDWIKEKQDYISSEKKAQMDAQERANRKAYEQKGKERFGDSFNLFDVYPNANTKSLSFGLLDFLGFTERDPDQDKQDYKAGYEPLNVFNLTGLDDEEHELEMYKRGLRTLRRFK